MRSFISNHGWAYDIDRRRKSCNARETANVTTHERKFGISFFVQVTDYSLTSMYTIYASLHQHPSLPSITSTRSRPRQAAANSTTISYGLMKKFGVTQSMQANVRVGGTRGGHEDGGVVVGVELSAKGVLGVDGGFVEGRVVEIGCIRREKAAKDLVSIVVVTV